MSDEPPKTADELRRELELEKLRVDVALARSQATREAIRKNWEYLRHAHLRGTDLTGIRLYQADLSAAYQVEAKLNAADLRGALIDEVDFTDSCLHGANIKDVRGTPAKPAAFRAWALDRGAVEMTEQQFDAWRQKGFVEPANWAAWRAAGFPINADGAPVVAASTTPRGQADKAFDPPLSSR
jgi:pentapeptide repeat protein